MPLFCIQGKWKRQIQPNSDMDMTFVSLNIMSIPSRVHVCTVPASEFVLITKLTNPQGNENLHQRFVHVDKENCGLTTLSHGSGMRQGHCMRTQMITCQMCNYQTVPSKECWVNINALRGMLCKYQTTPTEEFYTHIGAVLAAAIG